MNVICYKDLFLYIQQFINGEEYLIRNFRIEIGNNLSIPGLLKEALMATNWKVVDRIYQKNREHINHHILDEWKWYGCTIYYPHRVYTLLSTCKWLNERMGDDFCYWSVYMDTAACKGDLNVVEYIHTHRHEGCTTKAMDWASKYGQLDVVKFLHENRNK